MLKYLDLTKKNSKNKYVRSCFDSAALASFVHGIFKWNGITSNAGLSLDLRWTPQPIQSQVVTASKHTVHDTGHHTQKTSAAPSVMMTYIIYRFMPDVSIYNIFRNEHKLFPLSQNMRASNHVTVPHWTCLLWLALSCNGSLGEGCLIFPSAAQTATTC